MKPVEKFYFAFFKRQSLKLYFNEIKEYSMLGDGSLANIIKKLLEQNLITIQKTKGNTFYILSNLKIAYLYFMRFSFEKFSNLSEDVFFSLNKFNEKVPKNIAFVVIFGSASRNEEIKGESDIDLMIVLNKFNDVKLQKLYELCVKSEFEKFKIEMESNSFFPFSLFYTSIDEFEKANDDLICEVKNTGFPIFGAERFYEIVCKKWKQE